MVKGERQGRHFGDIVSASQILGDCTARLGGHFGYIALDMNDIKLDEDAWIATSQEVPRDSKLGVRCTRLPLSALLDLETWHLCGFSDARSSPGCR